MSEGRGSVCHLGLDSHMLFGVMPKYLIQSQGLRSRPKSPILSQILALEQNLEPWPRYLVQGPGACFRAHNLILTQEAWIVLKDECYKKTCLNTK